MSQMRTMREAFIDAVYRRMESDSRIWFLVADLGSPSLDRLREHFPKRFVNVGIAEQNLVNVATGLALEGQIVFCQAIAPFISMRAYEQIRVNLSVSSQLRPVNVNLIGIGGGVSYQVSGPTHHCLEDLSIMRLLPNMTVFCPSDAVLAEAFVDRAIADCSPKYLRFDGKALPVLRENVTPDELTKGFRVLATGSKVCIVATGYMTHRAVAVAEEVGNTGVIDLFCLKPFDKDALLKAVSAYDHILTVEEGFINGGGLDSAIASMLTDARSGITLDRLGFNDSYVFELGSRDYLHGLSGMDNRAIADRVRNLTGN